MNTLEEIWFLPEPRTWSSGEIMAMKDIGTLNVYPDGLIFKGSDTEVMIKRIVAISYGKQGRDFINNWVKVECYNSKSELSQVLFADGGKRGWSGIFGGTKKIYNLLKEIYNV